MNGTVTLVPNTTGEQAVFTATQAIYDSEGTVDLYAIIPISVTVDDVQTMGVHTQSLSVGSKPASNGRQATAFDVVTTPVIKERAIAAALSFHQNSLFDYFRMETRIALTNWVNLIRVNLMNTPVSLIDRVILSDNSYFDMAFQYQNQTYVYIPGSARDAVGNYIPENNSAAGGGPGGHNNYIYPESPEGLGAGADMIDHLQGLGVGMRIPGGIQLNNGFIIACVGTPSGTTCTIIPLNG